MRIFAIDPGFEQSALVVFDGARILQHVTKPNAAVNEALLMRHPRNIGDTLVIEQIASFGMPVGEEVFETVFWSGRFAETWLREVPMFAAFGRLKRHAIKMHLCGHPRAKDGNIRQALIDRFGPGRAVAIGTKKRPGPLFGIVGDEWAALAVAVTWCDQHAAANRQAEALQQIGAIR